MEFTDKTGQVVEVRNDAHDDAFAVVSNDAVAGHAHYRDRGGDRIFYHTVVGDDFGGRGLGSGLVRAALSATHDEGLTIVPVCPLVSSVIEKNVDEYAGWFRKPSPSDLRWLDSVVKGR